MCYIHLLIFYRQILGDALLKDRISAQSTGKNCCCGEELGKESVLEKGRVPKENDSLQSLCFVRESRGLQEELSLIQGTCRILFPGSAGIDRPSHQVRKSCSLCRGFQCFNFQSAGVVGTSRKLLSPLIKENSLLL